MVGKGDVLNVQGVHGGTRKKARRKAAFAVQYAGLKNNDFTADKGGFKLKRHFDEYFDF